MTFLLGIRVFVVLIVAVVVSALMFLVSVISDLLCFVLLAIEFGLGLGVVLNSFGVAVVLSNSGKGVKGSNANAEEYLNTESLSLK